MDSTTAAPINHREIALEFFGVEGSASSLPGYEDSNALITDSDGDRYVLRVSQPGPDIDRLRFVDEAMTAVQEASFDAPSARPTVEGQRFALLPHDRAARLLTWVPGITAEDAGRPPEAAISLGRTAGEMVLVLGALEPSPHRYDETWDPRYAVEVIDRYRHHVLGGRQRLQVEHVLEAARVIPYDALPVQVIHSDLNAGNVVLTEGSVTGVIDFEDVVSTIRIGELSAACAYAMLAQEDPVAVAMDVISGYRQVTGITSDEATHLYVASLSRLAVSVCVAASLPPDNPHQHNTSDITWTLLSRLLSQDTNALSARFEAAALS